MDSCQSAQFSAKPDNLVDAVSCEAPQPISMSIILGGNQLSQNRYPLNLTEEPTVRTPKWGAFDLTLKMNDDRHLSLTL